jgi:hypothetical protein
MQREVNQNSNFHYVEMDMQFRIFDKSNRTKCIHEVPNQDK